MKTLHHSPQKQYQLKRILSFLISVFALAFNSYAQTSCDSIITTELYSKYMGLTCMMREDLINAVKNGDHETVRKLRCVTVLFKYPRQEESFQSRLLTPRENVMIQFIERDYSYLVSDIMNGYDYFRLSKKNEAGYSYPNFECGESAITLLSFWQNQSIAIQQNIEASTLSDMEKDLLLLYWQSILYYIEAEKTLSPEIEKMASDYLIKHPDSPYSPFVKRLSGMRKIYQPSGMTLSIVGGKSSFGGSLENSIYNTGLFGFDVGYLHKAFHFGIGFNDFTFSNRDTFRLNNIDTIRINKSSSLGYNGLRFKFGYAALNKNWIRIQPTVNIEFNKLVNYISVPDSQSIRQIGKIHPTFNLGFETSIRLIKNVMKVGADPFMGYYPREERDIFSNPLFLTFRMGYYPNAFKKATGYNDSMLYWSVGLEWLAGKSRAGYRYKK